MKARSLAVIAAVAAGLSCDFERQIGAAVGRYCTERCMGATVDDACAQCFTYDAGFVRDAGSMVDAGRDAGTPDAGRDAGTPDAALPDAGRFTAQVVLPVSLPVGQLEAVVFGGTPGDGLPLRQVLTNPATPWAVTVANVSARATALRLDAPGAPSQYYFEGLAFAPEVRVVIAVTPDSAADGGIAVAQTPDSTQADFINALTERLRTTEASAQGFSAPHQAGTALAARDAGEVVLGATNDAGTGAGFQLAFPSMALGSDTFVLAGRWFAPVDDPTSARLYRVTAASVLPIKQLPRVYALDMSDAGATPRLGSKDFPTTVGSALTSPLPLVTGDPDGGRTVFFGPSAVPLVPQAAGSEFLAVAGANVAAEAPAPVAGSAPAVGVVNVAGHAISGVLADGGSLASGAVRPGFLLLRSDAGNTFSGAEPVVVPAGFSAGMLVFAPGADGGLARPVLIDTLRTPWQLVR